MRDPCRYVRLVHISLSPLVTELYVSGSTWSELDVPLLVISHLQIGAVVSLQSLVCLFTAAGI